MRLTKKKYVFKESRKRKNITRIRRKTFCGAQPEPEAEPKPKLTRARPLLKKKILIRTFNVRWSLDYDGSLTKALLNKSERIVKRQIKSILEDNISTSIKIKVTSISDYVVEVKLTYKNEPDYDDLDAFEDVKSLATSFDDDGNFPIKICENYLLSGQIV